MTLACFFVRRYNLKELITAKQNQEDHPAFISIGYINKAHGIRGEIAVVSLTDHPTRFNKLNQVLIEYPDNSRQPFEITGARIGHGKIIIKFKGVEDRTAAEELIGCYIVIPRDECFELPEDTYYIFDLIGLEVVTTQKQHIGTIEDILELPANDVYVVKNGNREILIPAVKEIIKKVDIKNQRIVIEPIEGLLEEQS